MGYTPLLLTLMAVSRSHASFVTIDGRMPKTRGDLVNEKTPARETSRSTPRDQCAAAELTDGGETEARRIAERLRSNADLRARVAELLRSQP